MESIFLQGSSPIAEDSANVIAIEDVHYVADKILREILGVADYENKLAVGKEDRVDDDEFEEDCLSETARKANCKFLETSFNLQVGGDPLPEREEDRREQMHEDLWEAESCKEIGICSRCFYCIGAGNSYVMHLLARQEKLVDDYSPRQ